MRKFGDPIDPAIHLLRGAPAVRMWSRHQQTVPNWTLCGIQRGQKAKAWNTVEDAAAVTCKYCLQLMEVRP